MSPLRNDEQRLLLQIARNAIESVLMHRETPMNQTPAGSLSLACGAFVSLHRNGRLRGCIGRIAAADPLAVVVADCAIAAATGDMRFSPLKPSELRELQIEVSVLSCPQRVMPKEVQPGVHGVIISRGENRGVLLPQVAAQRGWSRERFLEEACEKAGLARNAWEDPATRVEVFSAEVFSDADCQAQSADDHPSSAAGDAYSTSQ